MEEGIICLWPIVMTGILEVVISLLILGLDLIQLAVAIYKLLHLIGTRPVITEVGCYFIITVGMDFILITQLRVLLNLLILVGLLGIQLLILGIT